MQSRKAISITPEELGGRITDFFLNTYQFVPKFDIYYNRGIWLPVVIDLKEENSKDYFFFLEKLYHDVLQLKDKHTGDNFELGDKLVQLLFDCETKLYLFEDVSNYYEQYIRGDEAMVHILTEESHPPKKVSKKTHTTLFRSIKERLGRLLFTKEQLQGTAPPNTLLQEVYSEVEDNSLLLTYEFEGKPITVLIYFETKPNSDALKKISIHVNSYCESEEMYLKTEEIGKNLMNFFKQHPKYRLLHLYDEFITYKNESEYRGSRSFSHPAFTELENVILSMRIDGFNYQEIGERIHVTSMIALQNMVKHIQQKITKYGITLLKKEEV